jgi:7-cyano-7-deazaguanine synthase
MRHAVVLLSGGLDSIVLATMAERAGFLSGAVFVDYGQPSREQEREAVRLWCGKTRAALVELRAEIPGVDAMQIGAGKTGPRVIPCRNLILLSLAAGVAAQRKAREVWYGATVADQTLYPDCRPEFAAALSEVLRLENGVSIHAPLSGMRRTDVVALALALGVHRSETWSCYEPDAEGRPCGQCNSCLQDSGLEPLIPNLR